MKLKNALLSLATITAMVAGIPLAQADPGTVTATATATATATVPPPVTVTVTSTVTATPTTTTTAPPAPTIPAGSEYAAMGDSYSSGAGANNIPGGAVDPNMVTGNCQRSAQSAQMLLTAQFSWHLLNLACAGSTTANVLNTTGWEQPQMNLVTANTKLVTITIGGNDVQLLQLIANCMITTFYGDCIPTNNTGYSPTPVTQIGAVDTAITALEPKIEAVVNAIITKAPQAIVRLSGYPYVLPPPGQSVGSCAWLSSGEQIMFDQRLTRLNGVIQQGLQAVAAQNPSRNIQYLEPRATGSPFAFTDTGCSTASTRYMNGATGDGGAWHPNIYGQAKYAQLYQDSI